MSERQRIDLADPRNVPAVLRGKPVTLVPDGDDGNITIADAAGRPFWVGDLDRVRAELKFSGDLADLSGDLADLSDGYTADELYRAWERFVAGEAPEASTPWDPEPPASLSDAGDAADGYTADGLYDAWKAQAIEQGYDLAETDVPTLNPGDAVEWGSGHGVGHGLVMEVDTAAGSVTVHTCEVVTEGGAGPQLSPTGTTIKIDGAKLRKTSLRLVGEEPVGPELSADFSDGDPDAGNESDDSFYERVKKQLKKMGAGSVPSNEERIERVIGEMRSLVEDLAEEGRVKTETVEEEAEAAISRYADASDKLDSARRQIERFKAERETLPNRAYRAGLDEDYALEDELKARYKDLKPELETLRARVGELEAELRELGGKNPTPRGDLDAMIHAFERVRETYREAAAPLIEIQRQVVALLSDAVDPLAGGHRATGQTLVGLRDQRAGDPEVRARSLEKRGIRPEFVGAKPKSGV